MAGEHIGKVTGVNIFPIKSLQPATVDGQMPSELQVGRTGFVAHDVADRQWSLFYDGYFVSQRGFQPGTRKADFKVSDARLATVAVDIREDHVHVHAPGRNGGHLDIATRMPSSVTQPMRVHSHVLDVLEEGPEAAKFFTKFLGRGVRLMRANPALPRYVPLLYRRTGATNQVGAADGFPFLLMNQASLDALHHRAGISLGTVALLRFRANTETELSEPFIEDRLQRISIEQTFTADNVKPCKRCSIPGVDPRRGVVDNMAYKILGARAGDIAITDAEPESGMYLGANLNHQESSVGSMIAQGDNVFVVERSAAPNVRLRQAA